MKQKVSKSDKPQSGTQASATFLTISLQFYRHIKPWSWSGHKRFLQKFKHGRNKAANALLGVSHQTMSRLTAFQLVSPRIYDPGFHVILQALWQARRWILQANEDSQKQFPNIAAKQAGVPAEARFFMLKFLLSSTFSILHLRKLCSGPFHLGIISCTCYKPSGIVGRIYHLSIDPPPCHHSSGSPSTSSPGPA